ncbi:helix-turn-helix transcriptional regulator [Nocardioides panacisoli]|uniref:winged helix-turn-helix transcriptional regulator n=1 Tax=Nocardioides panacisoli TaxID=627624 RepID=UPI001C6288BA|nr:helix-turn-helix domain-containing protein [Nocardioides panacisoli]QYJ04265.1 helix-turn-helix transcriptional regulator [Nocardioides panacisoli]
MAATQRSGCPINLTVELLGDRWTLLILRDIVFADRRHFRELLRESQEGLTSSVLADRVERLVDAGVLVREDDPSHRQKSTYTLTDRGVDLVPVLATIGLWGATHLDADPELAAEARTLDHDLPASWTALMASLPRAVDHS